MNTRANNGQAKVVVKEQDHWMDRRMIKSVDIVLHHIVADFKMLICASTGTISNLAQMSTVVSPLILNRMHVVTKATQQVPVKVCPHDCKVPVMKIFPSFKVFFNDVGNLHSHLVSHFITLAK